MTVQNTNNPITVDFGTGITTTVMLPAAGIWNWSYSGNTVTLSHTTSSQVVHVDPPSVPEPEKEDIPILAQRYAGLSVSKGDVFFRSMNQKFGKFGIDEDAECYVGLRHDTHSHSPDWHCSCGFYAVPADKLPRHEADYAHSLILLVELSGEVIECEEGYRAGHQRVLEAYVPSCSLCGKPSTTLWIGTESTYLKYVDCGEHVYRQGRFALDEKISGRWKADVSTDVEIMASLTLDQVTEMAGIPFKQQYES